jgi:hypothetical protein
MSNTDLSFNRDRLIGIFLRVNNLSSSILISEFDDHFYFEDPLGLEVDPIISFYKKTPNKSRLEKNTKIYVRTKPSSPYFGRKRVKYNRISVADIPEIVINIEDETTTHELIEKINAKYRLYLTTHDIQDTPVSGSGDTLIDLVFKPTSLIFNDQVLINLTIDGGDTSTVYGPQDYVGGSNASD